MKSHVSRKGEKEARRTALYSTCGLRWFRNNHKYEGHHHFNHMTRHVYSKDRKEHVQFSFSVRTRNNNHKNEGDLYSICGLCWSRNNPNKYEGHHLFNHMRLDMFIPRRGRNTTVFIYSVGMRRKIH